jgi:hypothetical protein
VLVDAGVLSVLTWFEFALGGYALMFLVLFRRGYLLPLGGAVFGGIAVVLAQQWPDRRVAALATVVSIGVSALLYGLGAHVMRE